ncbi:MAG TPA: hypothetical protein VL754_20995 [Verrucomicrobiae bacterium]|nr:hypothetical protein [Verrucomicrobiae bacterium]
MDARNKLKLAVGVGEFLRDRVSVESAREAVRQALGTRAERFLVLAQAQIYDQPHSPYLKLLKSAGCDYSDLEALVHRDGLEAALERLAAAGVYLSSDEFKGKKEVVRGRLSFHVDPAVFERRGSAPGFATESSGTRNRPQRSMIFLDWLALRAQVTAIFFDAHDLFSYSHAVYDSILPGSAINHLLVNAKIGKATERWFARHVPEPTRLHAAARYLMTGFIVVAARRSFKLPLPHFVDTADLTPIVRWIESEKRRGKNCYVTTIASSAARLARRACEMGVALDGVKLNVAGEPFTEAKEDAVTRSGARFTSRYSYGGNVSVGFGCATPADRDEVHVSQNLLALIRHPTPLPGGSAPIHPLLLTTLDAEAPRFLLNVGNGDYGTLSGRNCGCALENAGLTLHVHSIRSFEKLTTEGMNYDYGDLFELLEKTIPAEFGGGPGDYQLVEEEDDNGQTRLTLVVDPRIGPLDETAVLARVAKAFASGRWGNRFMTLLWLQAGTFRLERRVPHASRRGKILPLHIPM